MALTFPGEVFATPSWLRAGAFVEYNQFFQWGSGSATKSMVWNITGISNNLADLRVTSYTFSVTDGAVGIFPVEASWRVNTETRTIVDATSGLNMTGYRNPFWVNPGTKMGSTIDAYFGTYATIQQAETIQALGQSISCWKVSLTWPTSTMQRWYDPATGIVLRIDSTLMREGITMHVLEKATASSIETIGSGTTSISPWPYLTGAVVAVGGVSALAAYFYRKAKNQTAKAL